MNESGVPKTSSLEQPTIEFLATDVFGIVQTGSRPMPGLVAHYYGSPQPTFQSNFQLSPLFGQALLEDGNGWVYLDMPGDELSFSGSDTTITSFTMGCYVLVSETFGDILTVIVPHEFGDSEISSHSNYRFYIYVDPSSKVATLLQSNSIGTQNSWANCVVSSMQGWLHIAFVYDQSTSILKTYMDGKLACSATMQTQSCCSNGAYESTFTKNIIFIFKD